MDLTAILNLIIATFSSFGQMVGVASMIVALINVFKTFGWVKDDTAGQWFAGLDFAAIVALILFQIFRPDLGIAILDNQAGLIGMVLTLVLGYIVSMGLAPKIHAILVWAKIKFISKSHSA